MLKLEQNNSVTFLIIYTFLCGCNYYVTTIHILDGTTVVEDCPEDYRLFSGIPSLPIRQLSVNNPTSGCNKQSKWIAVGDGGG